MSPAVAIICSTRFETSPAAASIAAIFRYAPKTKKPPMTPAAMRTVATMRRFVCLCIRTQDNTSRSSLRELWPDRARSELYVRLNEEAVLLRTCRRIVVHLLVGHDETD